MKESVKIKFNQNHLSSYDATSYEICNLGNFLTDDVGCFWPGWKKWALDPTQDSTTSNYARLIKEENYILIGDQYSEEPDLGPYLKITIEEFIKVLDQWEQLCKNPPKEVLITRENSEIKMEATY
jgi:hypothetical protein